MMYWIDYFTSFWNMIDMTSLIMNLIVIVANLLDWSNNIYYPLASITLLIMWLRMFYFGRMFFATAVLVAMIIQIVKDMKMFLIILSVSVLGFANAFYVIGWNDIHDFKPFTENSIIKTVAYAWSNIIGDFYFTEGFPRWGADYVILTCIWFIHTILSMFMFLNLLVAIMNDAFNRVQANAQNNMWKEFCGIMVENEKLMNRKN